MDTPVPMFPPGAPITVPAAHGDRTLAFTVYLWTNSITATPGHIIPKVAWASGDLRMHPNESHGIPSVPSIKWKTLADLPRAVEKLLISAGVRLVPDSPLYLPPFPTAKDIHHLERYFEAERKRNAWDKAARSAV